MPVNTQAAGGMGPGVLPNISIPNILPHAGNQQDLNYVMNLLNELSSQVRENRENTERIVEGVRRIHVRGQNAAPGPQVADSSDPDGEPNEHRPAESTSMCIRTTCASILTCSFRRPPCSNRGARATELSPDTRA